MYILMSHETMRKKGEIEKGKKIIQETVGIRSSAKSSSALEEKRFTTHSPHILVLLGL